ncbi:MAG: sensor domain-containing diguanylate cyclase [Candidatus Eisenbacteria bacterium]
MRRRNGAGSRQLVDATDKFRKGQIRLIQVMGERKLLSEKETRTLAEQVERAAAQKRSSDVLSAALTLNNRVVRVLSQESFAEAARQDSELEVLFEVSRLMQSNLGKSEVVEKLLDVVQQAIPYRHATLFLWNEHRCQLQPVACRGKHIDLIGGVQFDHGGGFSGWVAKQKRPILLTELHRGRRPDNTVVGSFMSVPMVVQEHLVGVLNLSHPRRRAFTEDHLRLLALIGGQAAATIQRILHYEEMQRLATTDDLTGVFNRRHFLERLQHELDRALRYRVPFGLMFLDIDNFKELNDNFGHQVGDRILAELGSILKHWARSSDLVARYGGEEFIVLLPMTDKRGAAIAAERLRARIQQHVFYRRKRFTVSVGVAAFPDDGEAAERLLGCVDEALYMAKNTGRNRLCTFGEQPASGGAPPVVVGLREEIVEEVPALEVLAQASADQAG